MHYVGSLTRAVMAFIVAGLATGDQAPVDLSGTWDAKVPVLNMAGLAGGSVIRIEQSPDAIRIRRFYGREALTNPPAVLTVRLDGSPSPHTYYPEHRPGLTGTLTSRAKWSGDSLVTVTTRTLQDTDRKTSSTTETTETFSRQGSTLTVIRRVSPDADSEVTELWIRRPPGVR